ncbi:site-specific integrase [Rhodoferax sediminis]|uniref:Site-specific integrase n=1 Tax=Rhodoferax sediminis TaxID=2509614 RepID=A0A515D6B4_9BURK|nr:site-specific integrase [Rhodoferax sediminis]QDL35963.1 site-specific integrase [Rhodoferax sediminis]
MASIRQRAGMWQARVTRKGFPAETRSFETRSEAQKWAREIESNMDHGDHRRRLEADHLLLSDILQRYMEEVSPTRKGGSEEAIRIRALQRTKMAAHSMVKLTPALIASFRDARLKNVGNGAVIRDLSILSSAINHARREWGVSVENPCLLVRKPTIPPGRARLLKPDEEVRLMRELQPIGRRSRWMAPLVRLALETAMRRGEMLGLKWEHVDLTAQTVFLPDTKNGTPRTVPLSTTAVAVLAELPRSEDGRVFQISAMTMEAAFRRACARSGIANLHFHDLRHTATSKMAEKLPNVIELAAVTGHRTIQMLKRYYHPNAAALAKKLG